MGTRTMTLPEAKAAYREAREADRLEEALEAVRLRVPRLEQRVDEHKARVEEWEGHLADLLKMREGFVAELERLPKNTRQLSAQEEDRIRSRRKDLGDAIVALDGADPRGTIVDHLHDQLRILGTNKRIAEEQELLEEAERRLEEARRQLND